MIILLSEEKKESEVDAKPAEDSTSEKPSVEDTAKAEAEKAIEEAKKASDATAKAEAAAKAVEEAENAVKEALAKAELQS